MHLHRCGLGGAVFAIMIGASGVSGHALGQGSSNTGDWSGFIFETQQMYAPSAPPPAVPPSAVSPLRRSIEPESVTPVGGKPTLTQEECQRIAIEYPNLSTNVRALIQDRVDICRETYGIP